MMAQGIAVAAHECYVATHIARQLSEYAPCFHVYSVPPPLPLLLPPPLLPLLPPPSFSKKRQTCKGPEPRGGCQHIPESGS
jgi:hypothetical protein